MNQNLFDSDNFRSDVDNNNDKNSFKTVPFGHLTLLTTDVTNGNVYIASNSVDRSRRDNQISEEDGSKKDTLSKGRYANIEEGLESSVGYEAKERISRIVSEVKLLSDVEKLLLYLRLPSGEAQGEDLRQTPTSCLHISNRVEQAQAYTWIKSHLEEDVEICLPKQEVYGDYKLYCDNHSIKPLSTADFGKLMKNVFPNVKPRRLGQRGQSRYCYGGLRKKLDVEAPLLPDLEISPTKQQDTSEDDELYSASCHLVCEWAHKLLGQSFSSIRELSEYLVSNLYVNHKSVSAFTVIASMQESGIHKVSSLFSNTTGGDRHRETQLQLQRKLQERELLREQKRKLQQQKEENEQRARQDRQTPLITSPSLARDRQTPLITSPCSAQERITPVISSPNVLHSTISSSISSGAELLRCQSANLSETKRGSNASKCTPGIKLDRSKSAFHFGMSQKTISSDDTSRRDVLRDIEMSEDTSKDNISHGSATLASASVVNCDSEEAMETNDFNLASSGQFVVTNDFIETERSKFTQIKSVCSVSKATRKQEEKDLKNNVDCDPKSSFHTIRKPAVISPGGLSLVKESPETLSQISDVESVQIDRDLNVSPTSLSSISCSSQSSSQSKVCASLFETEQLNACNTRPTSQSEESMHISPPSASSRSAFVPFSQVHGRKETHGDVQLNLSRIPSVVTTQSSSLLSLSLSSSSPISPYSPVSTSSIEILNCSPGIRQVVPNSASACQSVVSVSSQPAVKDIPSTSSLPSFIQASTESHTDNFVSMERVLKPPGSLPITTLCSSKTSQMGNLTNSNTECVVSSQSHTLPQASPTTPKKGKSRFTPIRPKASPQKTVSTILKEQKVGYEAGSYDKSKPVAALLKEKRAREAEMAQLKTNLSLSPGAPNQVSHNIQISNLQNFANLQNKLDVPGEFLIILNAAPQTTPVSQVSVINATPTFTQTFVTSAITSTVATVGRSKSEMGRCTITPVVYNSQSRSRTNSSSELEVESLIPTGVTDDDIVDVNMDEKPSKLAKIVDNDQIVSSRPGSRCSLDRETPSFGRKRKFHNNINIGHHKRINSMEDTDDEVLYEPKDASKESIRRAKSCSLENTERDAAVVNKENLSTNEAHYCPDISILEIDALSDDLAESEHHQLRSDSLHSCQQVQSAAVGVNSLSLRNSQRQLLKEKEALDKRMKYFWDKDEKTKRSQKVKDMTSMVSHKMTALSTSGEDIVLGFQDTGQIESGREDNVSLENMETESELPEGIADFITDALTGLNTQKDKRHEESIEMNEVRTEQCVSVDINTGKVEMFNRLSTNPSPYSQTVVDQPISPSILSHNNSRNVKEKDTITMSIGMLQAQNKNDAFVSPQRPVRRQRTPSVERILNPQTTLERNFRQQSPLDRVFVGPTDRINSQGTEGAMPQTPTSFPSPVHPVSQKKREPSVDRLSNQTPFSDAGYGSIGASPIMNSTPVSSIGLCDTTLNSTSSTGILMSRPDSVQSLASDSVQQSPIPPFSPRNYTSTPLQIRSPCPTPNKTGLQSPVTPGQAPTRAFMPIQQGLTQKIDGNVRLIKPIVTLASGVTGTLQNESTQITKDLIGIGSIQPENRQFPPPSYSTAVQSLKNFLQSDNMGAFDSRTVSKVAGYKSVSSSKGSGNIVMTEKSNTAGEGQSFASTCPCSYQLAMMSKKSQEVQNKASSLKNKESVVQTVGLTKTSVNQRHTVFAVPQQNKSDATEQIQQPKAMFSPDRHIEHNEKETRDMDIDTILNILKDTGCSPNPRAKANTKVKPIHGSANLPNSYYRGNTPNINIHDQHTAVDKSRHHVLDKVLPVLDDVEFPARRNLMPDLLEEPSTEINEEELQSTLEDLRSVDEKYFSQENFDMDFTSKRL